MVDFLKELNPELQVTQLELDLVQIEDPYARLSVIVVFCCGMTFLCTSVSYVFVLLTIVVVSNIFCCCT